MNENEQSVALKNAPRWKSHGWATLNELKLVALRAGCTRDDFARAIEATGSNPCDVPITCNEVPSGGRPTVSMNGLAKDGVSEKGCSHRVN